MSERLETQLGTYQGREYRPTVRVTPSFNNPDEFTVVVFYTRPGGESVQIARIDTEHDHVHFDRLYRRDHPKDPIDMDLWEAWVHLQNNWRTYAESYEQRRDE